MGHTMAIVLPRPLGMGQKVKYHLITITKSISKILYQTLCVFSQTYQAGFYSVSWVMPQGWDLGVIRGQKSISVLLYVRYAISS